MSFAAGRLLDYLKTYALYPLPQHALTRLVYWLTRRESWWTPRAISAFARAFDVNMNDALEPDLASYRTFNAFFTRALKPEARPVVSAASDIASPADGRISAIGRVTDARLFQAKGRDYSLLALLGGDGAATERLGDGGFATLYLSPRDYHRLHMPLSGRLIRQSYVPGRLFSVGPPTVRTLPDLFTRNERVIAQFETDHGLMAMVLVGAMNVAAIETVWHGLVTPPPGKGISHIDYRETAGSAGHVSARNAGSVTPVHLQRGAEMGRFNMGSTVIVLLENNALWRSDIQSGDAVRMGELLGQVR